MEELYIAPEGARQFEVIWQRPGIRPDPPLAVWVGNPIPIEMPWSEDCRCDHCYPVLQFTDPKHPLRKFSAFDKGIRMHKPVIVCDCCGRFIE